MIKRTLWTISLAILLVLTMAIPGNAVNFKCGDADVSLNGSIRYDVGYEFSDLGSTPETPAGQVDDKTDFFLSNAQTSRTSLKVSYDKILGYAEIGLKGNNSSNTVSTRHLYAQYKINDSNRLLIGQTTSILSPGAPDQRMNSDNALKGYGNIDHCRVVQLQYAYTAGPMTYKIALEDTRTAINASSLPGSHVEEGVIPAVLAAVIYSDKGIEVSPSAYFQSYDLKANDDTSDDVTVKTWALALDGSFKASFMTFSYEWWYGCNLSTLSDGSLGNNDKRPSKKTSTMGVPVVTTDGDIDDVKSTGGWLQFSVPIEPVIVNIGAGYQREGVENKDTATVQYESSIETKAVFLNFKYNILKGFYIQPEIAWYDQGNDAKKTLTGTGVTYADGDNDLGTDLYVGVHFQYDF